MTDVFPCSQAVSNDTTKYQYRTQQLLTATYDSVGALTLGTAVYNFIIDNTGLIYKIPSPAKQIISAEVIVTARSYIVAPDSAAEEFKANENLLLYGNVNSSLQPIRVDGVPLQKAFTHNDTAAIISPGATEISFETVQATRSFDLAQFQTTSVYTPDINGTWYSAMFLNVCVHLWHK